MQDCNRWGVPYKYVKFIETSSNRAYLDPMVSRRDTAISGVITFPKEVRDTSCDIDARKRIGGIKKIV